MARKKRTSPPSEATLEYRRLRRNIIARMKYREKQGFKVDYTTKPEIKSSATKRDVEKLTKYKVGLNQWGEVIADKPRSKAFVRKDFKGVTPSDIYIQNTEADNHSYTERQSSDDEELIVDSKVEVLKRKSQEITYEDMSGWHLSTVAVSNTPLLGAMIEDLENAYATVFELCLEALESNYSRYPREYRNNYYASRWAELAECFAVICDNTPSKSSVVLSFGNRMAKVIEMP